MQKTQPSLLDWGCLLTRPTMHWFIQVSLKSQVTQHFSESNLEEYTCLDAYMPKHLMSVNISIVGGVYMGPHRRTSYKLQSLI